MYYTCILRSISSPAQRYVGHTANLRSRLLEHNSGKSPHTAKFSPWKVEAVGTPTLEKICRVLQCNIGDIMDYVPDDEAKK